MSKFAARLAENSEPEDEERQYVELTDKRQIKDILKAEEIRQTQNDSILGLIDQSGRQEKEKRSQQKKEKLQFLEDDRQREVPKLNKEKKAENGDNGLAARNYPKKEVEEKQPKHESKGGNIYRSKEDSAQKD